MTKDGNTLFTIEINIVTRHQPMRTPILALLALLSLSGSAGAQTALETFLVDEVGVDDDKLEDLFKGDVVVELLEGDDAIELASFGAFVVPLPARDVMARLSEMARAGDGAGIQVAALLSHPPAREDMSDLPLYEDDIDELKECQVGDCKVKLPDEALITLAGYDWDAPGAEEQAIEWLRDHMHGYAEAYLEGGNSALAIYHDKEEPASELDGLMVLMDESPYLFQHAPDFQDHVMNYPGSSLSASTDDLLWTVQDLGIRPITTLTHVTTQRRSDPNGTRGLISQKQLYASHYFLAGLGITAVMEHEAADGPLTVVVQIDRHRFDDRLGRLQRHAVRGKLGDFVEDAMKQRRADLLGG